MPGSGFLCGEREEERERAVCTKRILAFSLHVPLFRSPFLLVTLLFVLVAQKHAGEKETSVTERTAKRRQIRRKTRRGENQEEGVGKSPFSGEEKSSKMTITSERMRRIDGREKERNKKRK